MAESILIVEDDKSLQDVLRENLIEASYQVETASTGYQAKSLLSQSRFDLILLDIMLPDTDGYSLCQYIRSQNIDSMILMLTARSLEDDIVKGFESGADDYLVKPYRLRELLMRVKALVRRQSGITLPQWRLDNIIIDTDSRQVRAESGEEINLTRKEFDLLEFFIVNTNRALTRQQILDHVWGNSVVVEERTVDNFISSLKKKLGWKTNSGFRFISLRGIGYRLENDI